MKSIKNAFKAVIFGAREYAGLYISIAILQILFSLFAISSVSTLASADAFYSEAYSYDLEITDREVLIVTLYNKLNTDTLADGGRACYTSHELIETGGDTATLRISLADGGEHTFRSLYYNNYTPDGAYSLSPRYTYFNDLRGDLIFNFVLLGALFLVLGVLVLAVMYSIRVNHYKFNYGIYLACGADTKMLYRTATSECGVIFLMTLVPSVALGYLCALFIYGGTRVSLIIHPLSFLIFYVMSLLTLSIAVRIPVRSLAGKSPLSLIRAEDNSDKVSSPRFSKRIFDKKYPWYYELLSVWRFRKYIAGLILSAVCFSAIFMTGIYAGNMIKADIGSDKTAFVISSRSGDDGDIEKIYKDVGYFLPNLLKTEGVSKVTWENSVGLASRGDHILLPLGTVYGRTDCSIPSNTERDGYTQASNFCRYLSIDKLTLEMYERYYDVDYLDGLDAESLPERENTVVLSESVYGDKHFSFEPGDKIIIARRSGGNAEDINLSADRDIVLREQINKFEFKYYEFTVGAVIRGDLADDSIIVGLNYSDFQTFAEERPGITSLKISVDEGIGPEELDAVSNGVRSAMKYFTVSWQISESSSPINSIAYSISNIPMLIYAVSCFLLLISPIVWILMQTVFYKKREKEFTLLRSFGARVSDIGKQHAVSGAVLALLSFAVTYLLSALACYLIYRLFSYLLPSLGFYDSSVPFDKYVSAGTLLVCAAVSSLCAALSELIPYLAYRRKAKKADGVVSLTEDNN